jgi:hypothetical protein
VSRFHQRPNYQPPGVARTYYPITIPLHHHTQLSPHCRDNLSTTTVHNNSQLRTVETTPTIIHDTNSISVDRLQVHRTYSSASIATTIITFHRQLARLHISHPQWVAE